MNHLNSQEDISGDIIILCHLNIDEVPYDVSALKSQGQIVELNLSKKDDESLLSNIYLGRVVKVIKNIGMAFVDIGEKAPCAINYKYGFDALFSQPVRESPVQGDTIMVQVVRDASDIKQARANTSIELSNRYFAVRLGAAGSSGMGVSKKISGSDRIRLRKWMSLHTLDDIPAVFGKYNLIARSEAAFADECELEDALNVLREMILDLFRRAQISTAPKCLYRSFGENLSMVYEAGGNVRRIITDDKHLYDIISNNDSLFGGRSIELYTDENIKLSTIYGVLSAAKRALSERVWLDCGAFLVIQQTEAFAAIDVNTGKYTGKTDVEETILKINLEAAKEAARQIRLRNLSGVILIDFINMKDEEYTYILKKEIKKLLFSDPGHAELIDITKLCIAEIVRKKKRKPLCLNKNAKFYCPHISS